MNIEIKTMDLMTVDRKKYVIAHCISACCGMGAGVVVPICKTHISLKDACKNFSFSQNKQVVGKTFRYADLQGTVYNMYTKPTIYYKAGVKMSIDAYHNNLKLCLKDLKLQMENNNEQYLAIPQIACGLDRCKWSNVEKIIKEVFKDSNINILVCIWG